MTSAADLLEGFDGPAACLDAEGAVVVANAAFARLSPAEHAKAADPVDPDWRSRDLPSGERLVQPDRRQAGLMRRADVLATLSHELRTPMNGVLGMAQLLETTRLDATQRAYLATIRECGDHLLELVGSVLDWARLDAGKVELSTGRTELEPLLQGVAELLSPQAHAKGLEIAWAVTGPVRAVLADEGRLRQILFNLAGNAVKMTATGGVRLNAVTAPGTDGRVRLRLEVADTGPGLSPEAAARIFEPFEQTEAGVRAGGAGLGLAIVRRLADALDGVVTVTSTPGEGAVFAFEAPATPVAEEQARPVLTRPPLAGRRVAVVTESAVVFQAAALQLREAGAVALRFDTPAAARAGAEPVDLVLYDVPAKARLRQAPAGAPTLVLIPPEGRGRLPALKARGYAGYLIKPLRPASLVARARAALEDASGEFGARSAEDDRVAARTGFGLHVLLAEDNPVNAMLARVLLNREACSVHHVKSGEEALAAALAGPYDLILLDLRMPGMDGLATARALREADVTAPIAALTANAFEDDRRACLDAGMDGFLTKPLSAEALGAFLAGHRPAAEAA